MEANDRESALRPLHRVGAAAAALREGTLPEEEARTAVIQVAAAVDASLRRLLRDFPGAAIEVRLKALAPDELRVDEALAELRQHERISIGLAATIHDLLEARRRLTEGGPLQPGDASLAVRAADRLEQETLAQPRVSPPAEATVALPNDATVAQPVAEEEEVAERRRRPWIWAAGVLAVVLVALGIWWSIPHDRGEMAQGVALFRSGAYKDAASHFWRYAQEHPDDATPHLYLARIHRRTHRYDLAAPELQKALQLAPNDAGVVAEAGFLRLDLKQYDAAVKQFRDALRLDVENTTAWVGLVRALREAGRADAAAEVLKHAPDDVRALFSQPTTPPDTTL
ncbi:MAG TPA: tetratricopeptide repeat protein [Longimicrobiaceae bacterium]|nr:tetratricopeptide repeat protein [Longimicrobiaceae bacterium]